MQVTLPAHLSPAVQAALTEAREALHDLYGARLLRLVLYGSHARGEAHDESDVDVLVVLDGAVDFMRETHLLVDQQLALFDRHGVSVHLFPFAAERYADGGHPLMMNVHEEGIVL